MNTVLTVLLLLSLAVTSGVSLQCYSCVSTTTNDLCNANTQVCQAPLNTCMTTVATSGAITAIVKTCSYNTTCNAAATVVSTNIKVSCCQTNLCNVNGSTATRLSALLLALPIGLLFIVSRNAS
ncbi:prostate stem cell antigen-like isoform X2 [Amia ocellicauda]|uniref:prostate stem cell antigen-like isoform X2 n=1 Tax=Amia ocellicauda TaxID=2972642 RepID=UPI0034649254